MIIGSDRQAVIENIKQALLEQDYYKKVENDDPVLTGAQSNDIVYSFIDNRKKISFKLKTLVARFAARVATNSLQKTSEIVGLENFKASGGAIITSNHFSPVENTCIRKVAFEKGYKKLNVVVQETNFAFSGAIGFLMNYADTIPLSKNLKYLNKEFISVVKEKVERDELVLIYPEQEMWFNYRLPRPVKRGAYYFAAKLNKPIVSCFVQMQELEPFEKDHPEFHQVKYIVHILDTLYPDPNLSAKENSENMCKKDYELKCKAYEKAYGKKVDYSFSSKDIAGWTGR